MKAVAYTRYSSDNQNEDSIEAQLREIKKYCKDNAVTLVHEYIDEEKSGKYDDRPGFQQMISDAKKGAFEAIILHKIDRFARNKYDSAIYKSQLKRLGIKLIYAAQPISDSPEGRLMEGILESFAEYYSDNLATEVMKGLKTKAYRGEFTGGYAPLGYDIVDKKFVVNAKEAIIVRKIFKLYAGGATYGEIFSELESKGYRTKFNAKFGKNSLFSILSNKKYIGIMEYNKSIPRVPGHRSGSKTKSEDEIIVVKDVIPPIIDEITWNTAQERKLNNKHKAQFKAVDTYLLTGLVKCGACDSLMAGHRTKNNQQRIYSYYLCKKCRNKIKKEHLEEKALIILITKIFSDDMIQQYTDMLNHHSAKRFNDSESEIEKLKSVICQFEKEINNIVNAISRGISSSALEERLITLEQAKKDSLFELARTKTIQESVLITPDEIKTGLAAHKDILKRGDIDECKPIVKRYIRNITIAENDKITFSYCLDTIGADEET